MMSTLKTFALVMAFAIFAAMGMPASAQQPASVNPTASSVKEEQLLNALKPGGTVSGRISIPDQKAANLIQPGGQDWRSFHQGTMHWIGALAILGMIVALVAFYMTRGKIMIEKGFSGRTITRFGGIDRFAHWLTAGCFIVLALSGLNLTFGKTIVAPILGDAAFASLAGYGKIAHNYLAFPFMAGLALMFLIWVKDNIPNSIDAEWIRQGGGLFSKGKHPPAKRFNAGQKLIFWMVIIGGTALSVSGVYMLFPYSAGGVTNLQFWTIIHGVVGLLLIGAMIAHAYIGSIGMEGAFDAMGSGQVDLNWANEHHSLWVQEELAAGTKIGSLAPAE